MGYIHINPMGLHGAGTVRKVNVNRAVAPRIFDMVLQTMEAAEKATYSSRQLYVRDRFIFIALRELGLRANELVKATMSAFYRLSDPQDGKTYWVMLVREETAKGQRERRVPVTSCALAALGAYREAFGLGAMPDLDETGALILSPRTSRAATTSSGRPILDVQSRRFFQAWRPVTTRHGLYHIVKTRIAATALLLERDGKAALRHQLRQASPHWLRHTFAKSALLTGQDIRNVASWLGHRDIGTTMVYTEQAALDLIRSTNKVAPALLAVEIGSPPSGSKLSNLNGELKEEESPPTNSLG